MSLAIAQLGQPILRRIADPVPLDAVGTAQFQELLAQMRATVDESGAAGLAAPQVFVSLRVFLALTRLPQDENEERRIEVFINPVLSFPTPGQESAWEACLSFPELVVWVPRHHRVRIEYYDPCGERRALDLEGFPARVVQHECDYLDGILTLDRAASTRDIIKASELEVVQSRSDPSAGASRP